MERASLQSIFIDHFAEYSKGKKLPLKAYRAAQAIMSCRTPAQGGHMQCCPEQHEQHIQYHSCRHRSCPRCNALPKARWAEQQCQRLLPVDHYHIIFTLPHELLPLWRYNSRWFTHIYFTIVRDTLFTLSKDKKHLGALPGLVLSLHTWGRNLSLHPHIHGLITGGGLDGQGQWRATRNSYLFPSRVVRKLYKGKLLATLGDALEKGELRLPPGTDGVQLLKRAARKAWHVRIQPPYRHGHGVMRYFARYVKGGPVSDHQITGYGKEGVIYQYTDHRDGCRKPLRLRQFHFMSRVLDHITEPRQHVIRHYGLYGHQKRGLRNQCRDVLGCPEEQRVGDMNWSEFLEKTGNTDKGCCTLCGKRLVRGMAIGEKSLIRVKSSGSGNVQPAVRANIETWVSERTVPPIEPIYFFTESMSLN